MKKLSLLIALMLCLTVGGVYATWSYAGTDDIADAYAEAKVTIANAELTGSAGTYKVESNLILTVDQANDDHEAELVFSSNNNEAIYLKVTFTPAKNASQEIKESAVPSELHFDVTAPMQYKMDADGNYDANGTATDIFKFADGHDHNAFSANVTWTKQGDAFIYTMNEDDLKDQIMLNKTFVLDTKAEHEAFRVALSSTITAHVTDGKVTQ